ncbi:hypothetical protein [Neptunicella sp. SCSIO 80796]|uniref:hypothetical protein n=1 Tax=Neptunicella plasticusilytica TaxID=3117012 RepID=UPI003A4DC84F
MIKLNHDMFDIFLQLKALGYQFDSFEHCNVTYAKDKTVFLRHDIDFDIQIALAFAKQEAEFGIKATYYFLLRSGAYNFISDTNIQSVLKIAELGHAISLHYDPLCYDDPISGLQSELSTFELWTGYRPRVISIHRPPKDYFAQQQSSLNFPHTYQHCYVQDITYVSDSGGRFRYGHPMQSEAVRQGLNLHLLIHPIWSVQTVDDAMARLDWLKQKKQQDLHQLMCDNCIPYREYSEHKEIKID